MPRVSPALLLLFLILPCPQTWGQWRIEGESHAQDPQRPFIHETKWIHADGEPSRSKPRRIDLVWFHASTHTFAVVDNGPAGAPRYPSLAQAMRDHGALAGCNGGFFHPDHSPSGLMISGGESTGRFGQGALLSGVILTSGRRNPYLLRRSEYQAEKYKATELLQSGPFLVDQGAPVRGLSPENSRRRTFVLHDGGQWFAIGLSDPFTLAELGDLLARQDFSPLRRIHRALNLDGGTSSGLYLDRGGEAPPLSVEPIKTVRNFVAIVPRERSGE